MFTKEDYVSLETAKLLKEKGFNEPCNAWYGRYGSDFASNDVSNHNHAFPQDSRYSKPTLYEAQKWLVENKGILVYPAIQTDGKFGFVIKGVDALSGLPVKVAQASYSHFSKTLEPGIRTALILI